MHWIIIVEVSHVHCIHASIYKLGVCSTCEVFLRCAPMLKRKNHFTSVTMLQVFLQALGTRPACLCSFAKHPCAVRPLIAVLVQIAGMEVLSCPPKPSQYHANEHNENGQHYELVSHYPGLDILHHSRHLHHFLKILLLHSLHLFCHRLSLLIRHLHAAHTSHRLHLVGGDVLHHVVHHLAHLGIFHLLLHGLHHVWVVHHIHWV
mmetsp:Transcript_29090/g.55896  ORF Transcript_29090/g.55896 Transcript_29090/m.55896 type:complete len:205 (+) Transcript_29090:55-669(+)